MIITDKFVFLHYPKTGGCFVREVLQKVYKKIKYKNFFQRKTTYQELMVPNLKKIHQANILNEHGTYEQIPKEDKNKLIISSIRNPFELYVSIYKYRSWIHWPSEILKEIKEKFPVFPDLNFKEYLLFINLFGMRDRQYQDLLNLDIGVLTFSFFQFFFKDPKLVISKLDEVYLQSDIYKKHMPEIVFLHTENLNLELYNMLLKLGYHHKDISFIINKKKVNITQTQHSQKSWREYYNIELYEYVKFKERFILRLFPIYDEQVFQKEDTLINS